MYKRFDKYKDRTFFMRATSEKAILKFPDNSLDFVYIDGDHSYDAVLLDIILWHRKVKDGGILAGHDYQETRKHGVKKAVDDYVKYHNIDLQLFDVSWYWEVTK
jgi:hypothetical protein